MTFLAALILITSLASPLSLSAKGVDLENGSITIALRQEPPNLDSSLSEDTTSSKVLRLSNEGLVGVNRRGQVVPRIAKSWDIEVMQMTFHLRDNAKWSNGDPVTAHDFVYSWRRLVDPKTGARGSTLFAHLIANADEIMSGELPAQELGVEALDDFTFRVTLSQPASYFIHIASTVNYFPLNQKFVEAQGDRHAADAKNILSNGPFIIDEWVHSANIELSRNPHYWNKEEVRLEALDFGYITADSRSLLNLYNSGDIAELELEEDILKDAINNGLRIRKVPRNCIAWVWLNSRESRATSDRRLREAIRLALDRDAYVNNIVALPGTERIDSPFTKALRGVKGDFSSEYPTPEIEYSAARGKALIEEIRAEKGEVPPVVLLANETRQIEAEFIQGQLISKLGLDVKVDKQTFKQAIEKQRNGDFDLARVGFCGGSLTDPITYAASFESTGPFNDGGYNNPEYDRLINVTRNTIDPVKRMEAFDEMQKLIHKDIPMIPTHQYSYVYIQDQRLAGFQRYPIEDFSRGRIR
ncbi:MAG: peptide ABC transporter substrate-binding protein [Pseudomonadales bacterium]|nr:peptide ABC transporter substrate-binding protein [Pseudomonadales bacterium]MBO6702268.1 peptide ABC transporter substrate-binding protein [Pseudomonadales bacterium]MBO7007888.1 peptide ABC transporter substrate-binding protein [Pseudomonadales bacterium]